MEEVKKWMETCPIKRFEERLLKERLLTKGKIKGVREEIEKKINEAVEFAVQSPFPEPQDIYEDVYI
jgi:pyruvate dehydrogenase E1 component alpha subunit